MHLLLLLLLLFIGLINIRLGQALYTMQIGLTVHA